MRVKKRNANVSITPFCPIQALLGNRGISPDKYDEIFTPKETQEDKEYKYELLEEAVEVFKRALKREVTRFGIIMDCDCDGVTSSSMLYMFLKEKYSIDVEVFFHDGKSHGLSDDIWEDLEKSNVNFLFIPDAGSNDYDRLSILNDQGVQVVILDHHEADYRSEESIVINNQLDKLGNKSLTGVGMTYKFIRELDKARAKKYLDLVALGQIADVSDATNSETRWYMHKGIDLMNKGNYSSEFIKALKELRLKKAKVTIQGVGFYLAPFINACCRMGDKDTNERMFRAIVGEEDIKKTLTMCQGLKETQDKLVEEGFSELLNQVETTKMNEKHAILVCNGTNLYPTIKGLVANKIAQEYERPCLVLTDKGDILQGSGRGYEDSTIPRFKDWLAMNFPKNLLLQGHLNAFGYSIRKEDVVDLYNLVATVPFKMEGKEYLVDDIYESNQLFPDLIKSIGEVNYVWGNGLSEPLFYIKNIEVDTHCIQALGKDVKETVKFSSNGIDYIKFKVPLDIVSELCYSSMKVENNNYTFDIVGRFCVNEFAGRKQVQVQVEEWTYKKSSKFIF